jgi:hypothetical protein
LAGRRRGRAELRGIERLPGGQCRGGRPGAEFVPPVVDRLRAGAKPAAAGLFGIDRLAGRVEEGETPGDAGDAHLVLLTDSRD